MRSSPAPPCSTPRITGERSTASAIRGRRPPEGERMATAVHTETVADAEALARTAAKWLVDLAAAGAGRFAIGLSGGSTPKRLYQLLAQSPFRERLPWDRVHWFWGDERFVPRDHPDSNYRMVNEAMLSRAPVPKENIHGIPVSGAPAEAAREYQRTLMAFYGAERLDPA